MINLSNFDIRVDSRCFVRGIHKYLVMDVSGFLTVSIILQLFIGVCFMNFLYESI